MVLLNIGTEIFDDKNNKYKLVEIIGQGGFGCVFKAIRHSDGKIFAVKTMLPAFDSIIDQQVFENEISISSKIYGENVIKYEFVNDGKTLSDYPPYIIMEYASGGTLKNLIEGQKKQFFSNEQIVSMFEQLANGMKTINRELVHRDIKPENILVSGDRLKITDFGLSKIAIQSTRTNTFKGWGTMKYMSPEAWTSAPNTLQMDIYSMGIVFFEIATLQYPYDSPMDTFEECKRVHLNNSIKNINNINPNLSANIVSVISKMLEKPEKRRFKNWDEVLTFLEKSDGKINTYSNIVDSLIIAKNTADIAKQKEIEMLQKQKRDQEELCSLVKSQFENEILLPIKNLISAYNNTCASNDKFTPIKNGQVNSPEYYYEFKTPFNEKIILCIWTIFENSLKKEEYNFRSRTNRYRSEILGPSIQYVNYTLKYNEKPVIGLVKIFSEKTQLGFNMMLVRNSGLYGDWYILNCRNNFSFLNGRERKEPFAFDLKELPKQIEQIHVTGNYSLDVQLFSEGVFMQKIDSIISKQ